jgi:S-adenosylmethionine decarboxylase
LKGDRELTASWNLGINLLVELYDCNPAILKSLKEVRDVMVSAVKEAKTTILDISFHEFNPFEISGVVIIEEGGHLTIHTCLNIVTPLRTSLP